MVSTKVVALCALCLAAAPLVVRADVGYGRGPTGGGFGGGSFGGGGFGGGGGGGGGFGGAPQPYSFQYAVKDAPSGNNFGQEESGDGNGNVRGTYQVQLPDGRNQVVRYTASDATGYVADVSYSGQPSYPSGGGGGGGGGFGGGFGGGAGSGTYLPPFGKK